MRARRILTWSAALGLGLAVTLLGQCFAPSYHDCAFRCSPSPPQCPDEYECRSDDYCHLRSSAVDAGFCALPDGGSLGDLKAGTAVDATGSD